MSDKELSKLGETAGVDFVALRMKYAQAKSDNCLHTTSRDHASAEDQEKRIKAEENLSKYKICLSCHGLGVVKFIYNHMTLEKSCEICDGDSIVLLDAVKNETKKLSSNLN